MRLYGALIYTDFLLLESIRAVQAQILSEYNPRPSANTRLKEIRSIRSIRVRLTSEFFRTRIYRIDTDASLGEVLSSRQQSLYVMEIPRLRPGLLSLRSVLASSQILWLLVIFE